MTPRTLVKIVALGVLFGLAVAVALLITRVANGQTNRVPVDAQSQLMQPRKPTLEQRVRRLERIVLEHERRLTPTPAKESD